MQCTDRFDAKLRILKKIMEQNKHDDKVWVSEAKRQFRAAKLFATEYVIAVMIGFIEARERKIDIPVWNATILHNRDQLLKYLLQEHDHKVRELVVPVRGIAGQSLFPPVLSFKNGISESSSPLTIGSGKLYYKLYSVDEGFDVGDAIEFAALGSILDPTSLRSHSRRRLQCARLTHVVWLLRTCSVDRMAAGCAAQQEQMDGSNAALGFMWLYDLFTQNKEIKFERPERRHQHTFASLAYSLFSDFDKPGTLQTILSTLMRNPWVCQTMPTVRGGFMGSGVVMPRDNEGAGQRAPTESCGSQMSEAQS